MEQIFMSLVVIEGESLLAKSSLSISKTQEQFATSLSMIPLSLMVQAREQIILTLNALTP
jgi:hypothetical protein